MLNQNNLLRRLAGGRFEDLAQAISRDPAMLLYLDSATNRKSHPNENYARELMELFCLGVGAYSEQDVRQLARSLTGWEVRHGGSRFNPSQYDPGEKTLLGQTGKFDLRPAVSLVCEQPAASLFLARKLVQFFVADEPLASDELIEPLARELRERGLLIAPLVERVVSSQLFFSDLALQRKVRSPVELGVGTLRALEATTDLYVLGKELAALGQSVFFPPSVKGWDGGRAWINSATLLGRTNLIGRLIHHPQTRFAGGNLESLALRHNCRGPEDWTPWLIELLAPAPIPAEVQERLTARSLASRPLVDRNKLDGWCRRLAPCRNIESLNAPPEDRHVHTASILVNRRRWALVSFSPFVPNFLRYAAAAQAEPARGDRILVIVELTGGNDGLNTIVPYADDAYLAARKTLAIGGDKVLKIDDQVGFAPARRVFRAAPSGPTGGGAGCRLPQSRSIAFFLDGHLADRPPQSSGQECWLAGAIPRRRRDAGRGRRAGAAPGRQEAAATRWPPAMFTPCPPSRWPASGSK